MFVSLLFTMTVVMIYFTNNSHLSFNTNENITVNIKTGYSKIEGSSKNNTTK